MPRTITFYLFFYKHFFSFYKILLIHVSPTSFFGDFLCDHVKFNYSEAYIKIGISKCLYFTWEHTYNHTQIHACTLTDTFI